MPFAVAARMSDEVVRPARRARRLAEELLGARPERGDDLAMHFTVVRDHRGDRTTMPALVEEPVLSIDRQPSQRRIARLVPQRAERLALPLDDVRKRVLGEPAFAADPGTSAESGNGLAQAPLAETADRAVERAVLGDDPREGVSFGVPNLYRRAVTPIFGQRSLSTHSEHRGRWATQTARPCRMRFMWSE